MTGSYWNHNTAYHGRIVAVAAEHRGRVLDVGCGDGLLLERLAPVSRFVTGIDREANVLRHARERTASLGNVAVEDADFATFDAEPASFDVVVFVAVLHHLELRPALERARRLLATGGDLVVVGLSRNSSATDWAWAAATTPVVRVASLLHRERRDPPAPIAAPLASLADIRSAASEVLPGAVIRRGLYFRYLLRWTNRGAW